MHRKSEKPNLGKGRNQGSSEAPGSRNQKILSVGYLLRGQSAPPGFCVVVPSLQQMRISLVSLGSHTHSVTGGEGTMINSPTQSGHRRRGGLPG